MSRPVKTSSTRSSSCCSTSSKEEGSQQPTKHKECAPPFCVLVCFNADGTRAAHLKALCVRLLVHSNALPPPHTLSTGLPACPSFPPGSLLDSFSLSFASFLPTIVLFARLRAKATPQAAASFYNTPNNEDKQAHMPGLGPGHGLLQHDLGLFDALPQCQGTGADTGTSCLG